MKNENDLNEMGEILDCLGKYIPCIENIEYDAPFPPHPPWWRSSYSCSYKGCTKNETKL